MILKRKNRKGDIRYGVRVDERGKQVWLGTFSTLREAREAERAHKPSKGSVPSCDVFARLWLAQGCPRTSGRLLKADTLRGYEIRLRGFIERFEGVPLTRVSRADAFEWAMEHRAAAKVVAGLFAHAHDLGLVEANPFEKLGLAGSRGRKDNKPLTEQELYELADAALDLKWQSDYGPQFRAFILFQAFTGLRPGESFALKWSDIEGDRIHVQRRLSQYGTVDSPKSGVGRVVLLPPPASVALRSFPRGLDLVFRGVEGQQLSSSTSHHYFKRVREQAGRPDLDVYDLRHFCAHHLYVGLGLPARVVAAQLGHRDGGRLVESLYGHGEVGALDLLEEAWTNVG